MSARQKTPLPLFAAVFDETDPRSLGAARAVPERADKVTSGASVLGYWKEPGRLHKQLPWSVVVARQRFNELARLVSYRQFYGLDMGPPSCWAIVLANLAACIGDEVDVHSVSDLCRRLKLVEIDPDIVAGVCRDSEKARRVWSGYDLQSASAVGAMIQLTAAEREDCQIKRIDSWDERKDERRRRLARERKRRQREKRQQA